MADETYMLLRITGGTPRATDSLAEPFRRGFEPGLAESAEPPAFRVDAESLSVRDVYDARRDPQVAGMAAPIPIQLIQPVEEEGLAAPDAPGAGAGATWGVSAVGALTSPYTGAGVTVAVLDTGIDAGHEAFAGVELIQRDFLGEGDGDRQGHGTHVAGTIFGRMAGGLRYSVAPGVSRALIGKVLSVGRSSTTKEIVDAIQWAVNGGAQIINMSLAFDFPGLVARWVDAGMTADLATSRALEGYGDNVRFFDRLVALLAAQAAFGPGALLVAAAGNQSRRALNASYRIAAAPPAAAEGILSVAALHSGQPAHGALAVAAFSNSRADVAAPGQAIYSAKKGSGYTHKSGTSMASPHVAGVAALWAERQLRNAGMVNLASLAAQVRGHATMDGLAPGADRLDVGDGLVRAPQD